MLSAAVFRHRSSVAAAVLLTLAAASCSSTTKGSASARGSDADTEWLEPSPALKRDIQLKAMEVEVIQTPDDFVRLSDWFQHVGEPAYPKLLEMVGSGDARARSFAMSVISAMRDPRLLDPFREAVSLDDLRSDNHRYDYARAILSMGDFDGAPILIGGLEDPNPQKRALAYRALGRSTNTGIGFDPHGSEEERAESIAKWRRWWAEVNSDPMLDRE